MSVTEFDLLTQVRRDTGQEGRQVGRDWLFRCPAPSHHDNRPSFAVSWKDDRWVYNCRSRCGGGDAASYLVLMGRAGDQAAALAILRGDDSTFTPRVMKPAPIVPPPRPVPTPFVPMNASSLLNSFLSRRGWTDSAAELFGLSVVLDRYGQPRVRFPWTDQEGRVVWYQDRDLGSSSSRWLAPPGVPCPWPFGRWEQQHILDELFASPTWSERGEDIWLCEGPSDAVALASGFPDTVAHGLPGGNLSRDWVSIYSGRNVFVVFDNDASGEQFRDTVRSRLSPVALGVWDVRVPPQYNDLSEWQLADEDFSSSLVSATVDAMESRCPTSSTR